MIIDGEEYPSREHYLEALRRELSAMSDEEFIEELRLERMLVEAGKVDDDSFVAHVEEADRRFRNSLKKIKDVADLAAGKLN